MSLDLLSLIPETDVRKLVCYCLNDLHLSLDETQLVISDARRIVQAMTLLLNGRLLSTALTDSEPAAP